MWQAPAVHYLFDSFPRFSHLAEILFSLHFSWARLMDPGIIVQ